MMRCNICSNDASKLFDAVILGRHKIDYYRCPVCEFIQTEKPYWLNEAYERPVSISDTGYLQRNIYLSKQLTILLALFFNKNGKFLDYGGYGVFVRLMRGI